MCRFKVEILIDEEKVIADDRYEPEILYKYIRDMFKRFQLCEIKTDQSNHIIFIDRGTNKDMAGLASAAVDLYNTDWFSEYAMRFLWISRNRDGSISKSSIFDELKDFEIKGI